MQDSLEIVIPDPENDYQFDTPPRCQRCFVGPPSFLCYPPGGDCTYYCEKCIIAILEEMKLRGAELWKEYEAQLQSKLIEDELVDVEEHKARRLELFGA